MKLMFLTFLILMSLAHAEEFVLIKSDKVSRSIKLVDKKCALKTFWYEELSPRVIRRAVPCIKCP